MMARAPAGATRLPAPLRTSDGVGVGVPVIRVVLALGSVVDGTPGVVELAPLIVEFLPQDEVVTDAEVVEGAAEEDEEAGALWGTKPPSILYAAAQATKSIPLGQHQVSSFLSEVQ